MPPHLIEREPRKWKKDEWKSLPQSDITLILFVRKIKINQTRRIAEARGIDPIYPSDDDDLAYKESRPHT
jgi:hypothetical protein